MTVGSLITLPKHATFYIFIASGIGLLVYKFVTRTLLSLGNQYSPHSEQILFILTQGVEQF